MSDDPEWLRRAGEETANWVLRMEIPGSPGFIQWAEDGLLHSPHSRTGLAPTCFALKALFMLGRWNELSVDRRDSWTHRIRSFRREGVPLLRGGFFDWPLLLRALAHTGLRQSRLHPGRAWDFFVRCVRGETRQALSSLVEVGVAVDAPPEGTLWTADVNSFVRTLDWNQPWAAAAQLSNVVFFAVHWFRQAPADLGRLREAVSESLESVFRPETGAWYEGEVTPEQGMNGAMKVLTGSAWLDLPIPSAERLIDYCLDHPPKEHGCAMTDRMYVLQRCSAASGHRTEEVRREAVEFIRMSRDFYHEGGGFRYFPDRSQTHYYGARITQGRRVPDVHGTCLFVWGLVLAADILRWREDLGWNLLRA